MKFLNDLQSMLEQQFTNPYILGIVKLLIILYSCLVAPTLPVEILAIFDNTIVKILVLVLIFYSASIEPMMAILLGVGLFITLQTLNNVKLLNLVNDQIESLEETQNSLENAQENAQEEVPANVVNNETDETPENGCYPAVTITKLDNNNMSGYTGEDYSNF
jgi:hypothetical protein